MDLQAHKRTLGIIHLIYGLLITVTFFFLGSIIEVVSPIITGEIMQEAGENAEAIAEMVISIIRGIFILLFIFSALPSIIAGIGLIKEKSWGVVIALIAGCISIFSFPFGTAIGVYSIYVFVQNNRALKGEPSQG